MNGPNISEQEHNNDIINTNDISIDSSTCTYEYNRSIKDELPDQYCSSINNCRDNYSDDDVICLGVTVKSKESLEIFNVDEYPLSNDSTTSGAENPVMSVGNDSKIISSPIRQNFSLDSTTSS